MSLWWTVYVAPVPQDVRNCDNFETVRDMIDASVNHYRKSHTIDTNHIAGFRLVPTSVILSDLDRRNSSYFALFNVCEIKLKFTYLLTYWLISSTSIALQADYVTVVEDRPIMSEKYSLSVIFGQKRTHTVTVVAWSLRESRQLSSFLLKLKALLTCD